MIVLIFLIFLSEIVYAQNNGLVKNITATSGLLSNNVFYTFSDSKGYLWFGTDKGVSRYNGLSFTNFSLEDGLPSNDVFIIDEDKEGRIWFGTYDSRLTYYENDSIYQYKFNDSIVKYFPKKTVKKGFLFNPNGDLYLADLGNSLLKIDKAGNITRLGQIKVNFFDFGSKLLTGQGKAAFFNGTSEKYRNKHLGVNVYNGEAHLRFYKIPRHNEYKRINQDPPFAIKTSSNSILCVKGGRVMQIKDDGISIRQGVTSLISVFQDDQGFIWIGTRFKGVYVFRNENLSDTVAHLLNGHSITNVARDFQGGLWISSLENGVFHFPISPMLVRGNSLPNSSVKTILKGPDDLAFVLFKNGKLYEIDGNKTCHIASYNKNEQHDFPIIFYDILSNTLYCKNANFDIPKGLKYSIELINEYQDFPIKSRIPFFIKSNSGTKYLFHARGIYIINNGYNFISESDQFEFNKLHVVNETKDTIWMGSEAGLFFMAEDKIHQLNSKYTYRHRITAIHGNAEVMAVGIDNGLWLRQPSKNTLLTKKNGLDAKRINALFIESDIVWIATDFGLYYVNWKDKINEVRKVSRQQGVSSSEIFSLEKMDGELLLGSQNGLIRFNKSLIDQPIERPRIMAILKSINARSAIHYDLNSLQHDQNDIEIELTALAFSDNANVKYKWKLNEADNNWKEINQPNISFKKLNPGTYTVSAICSTLPGIWSEATTLYFVIQSPIWLRWWFVLIEISIGIVSIVVFMRYRINKAQQIAQKELKALQKNTALEMKALRAQMNPHFVFNTMNSVLSLIKQNKNKEAEFYLIELSKILRSITEKSPHAMISLKEELLITEQYVSLENLRFGDDIHFIITVDSEIDQEKLQVPGLLIQPFVENAIVHGLRTKKGEKQIKLTINKKNSTLFYTIEDNGIGREQALIKTKRNSTKRQSIAISNSKQRIELINSMSSKNRLTMNIEDLKDENGLASGTKISMELKTKI